MKNMFTGYYDLTNDELITLWNDCIFSIDANVLLRMYRYTEGKETLIKLFENISDRLFLTHQASMEYHEKLREKITEQKLEYEKVKVDLNKRLDEVTSVLTTKRLHLSLDSFAKEIIELKNKINSHIDAERKSQPNLNQFSEDLARIFHEKVGRAYTQEELDKIYEEGAGRYEKKVAPGWGDIKEKEKRPPRMVDGLTYVDKYGDLVMWYQLINEAKEKQKPIIFITEDLTKGDWIELNKENKVLGVHPSLRQEFIRKTGQHFTIYSIEEFLRASDQYLKASNIDSTEVTKAIENVIEVEKMSNMDPEVVPLIRSRFKTRNNYNYKNYILLKNEILELIRSLEDKEKYDKYISFFKNLVNNKEVPYSIQALTLQKIKEKILDIKNNDD